MERTKATCGNFLSQVEGLLETPLRVQCRNYPPKHTHTTSPWRSKYLSLEFGSAAGHFTIRDSRHVWTSLQYQGCALEIAFSAYRITTTTLQRHKHSLATLRCSNAVLQVRSCPSGHPLVLEILWITMIQIFRTLAVTLHFTAGSTGTFTSTPVGARYGCHNLLISLIQLG